MRECLIRRFGHVVSVTTFAREIATFSRCLFPRDLFPRNQQNRSVQVNLLGDNIPGVEHTKMIVMATIALMFILATNMFTEMRVVSVFAMVSAVFFIIGTGVIMFFTLQQPSQWERLPSYTNFKDTIIFVGITMYAFEGCFINFRFP